MNEQANPPSTDQQLADARIASTVAQVRIAELEKQVVAQRAQIDQAISNLRAIVALNDDPHIDEICRVTADALGAALRECKATKDT